MPKDFTKSTLNYPVGAPTPIRRVSDKRAPNSFDTRNFIPGDEWLDTTSKDWWKFIENTSAGALWVKIGGTNAAIETFDVDASSGGGTDPVEPNASNEVILTASTVAAGTTPLRSVSTAANTVNYQIQQSQAVAAPNATNSGICHFDNSHFSVDANGFVQLIGGGGSTDVGVQVFQVTGNYTPTSGAQAIMIECIGAGGGGGGVNATGAGQVAAAGGGGAGAYSRSIISPAPAGPITVTVGVGGTGGADGTTNGGTGGASSVGVFTSAQGGGGGTAAPAGTSTIRAGGLGGDASAGDGDVLGSGSSGHNGFGFITAAGDIWGVGGRGGDGPLGSGGQASYVWANGSFEGSPGQPFGCGGSGAANGENALSARFGGDGSNGIVIITEYF